MRIHDTVFALINELNDVPFSKPYLHLHIVSVFETIVWNIKHELHGTTLEKENNIFQYYYHLTCEPYYTVVLKSLYS